MFVFTKELVKNIIDTALANESPRYRTMLHPITEMSAGQRKKMSGLFTSPCNFEDAIYFCDMSFLGSGKKGFVITKDGIYFTKGFMGYAESSLEVKYQTLFFAYVDGAKLPRHSKRILQVDFHKSRPGEYTLQGLEEFFALILDPLANVRIEAEHKEWKEKFEAEQAQKKAKLQAELEEIRKREAEEKRIEEEAILEREKKAARLIEAQFQARKFPGYYHFNTFHDTVEYKGTMYFLAETVEEPGELNLFQLLGVSEEIGDLRYNEMMFHSSAKEILAFYFERQKKRSSQK